MFTTNRNQVLLTGSSASIVTILFSLITCNKREKLSISNPWSLYLMVPMFHILYDMGNSINCDSMYFILGGVSPGREFLVAPG